MIDLANLIPFRRKPPIEKLNISYDIERLRAEVLKVLSQVELDSDNQLMLACRPGSSNPNFEGKGKLFDKQKQLMLFEQSDFTEFNPNFTGGYLEEIWRTFPYPVGRFRIAVLPPHRCYSLHRDREERFHIPVITNSRCYFLFENFSKWYTMPADGSVYRMDTQHRHSAVNMGNDIKRIHLLFDSKFPFTPSKIFSNKLALE